MYRHLEEIPPKDTETKDTEAVQPDAGVQQQDFPSPRPPEMQRVNFLWLHFHFL